MESEAKSRESSHDDTNHQLLQRLLPLYPRQCRRIDGSEDELLEEQQQSNYVPPNVSISSSVVAIDTHASAVHSHPPIQIVIHELRIDNTPIHDVAPALPPASVVVDTHSVPMRSFSLNHSTKSRVTTQYANYLQVNTDLSSLNSLLQQLVLSYLDYRSLLQLMATSCHWRRICVLDTIWLPLCQQLPIAQILPSDPIKSRYHQAYRVYRLLVQREHEKVVSSYRSEVELAKDVRCDTAYHFITAVLTPALLLGGFAAFFILLLYHLQVHSSVHTWMVWILPVAVASLLFVCSGFFICLFQIGDTLRKCHKRCCTLPLLPTRQFIDASNAPFMYLVDHLGGYQWYYRFEGVEGVEELAYRRRVGARNAQCAFLFVALAVTGTIVLLCIHVATLQLNEDDTGESIASSFITSSKHAFAFLCIPLYLAIVCFVLCQPSVRWIDIRPIEHFTRCLRFGFPYALALIFLIMRIEGVKVPMWAGSHQVLVPVSLIFIPTWLVDLYVVCSWAIPNLRRKAAAPALACLIGLLPFTVFKILLTLRVDANMTHLTPIAIASPLFLPMLLVALLTFYYPFQRLISASWRWIPREWPTPPPSVDQFTPPEFVARFRVQYLMQRALLANAPLQIPLAAQ